MALLMCYSKTDCPDMHKILLKVLFLSCLMIIGISATALAQKLSDTRVSVGLKGVYGQSVEDFAKEKNIGGWRDNEIFCGDKQTFCNVETQVCLKCSRNSETVEGAVKEGQKQTGECINYTGRDFSKKMAWELAKRATKECFKNAFAMEQRARDRNGFENFFASIGDFFYDVDYTISIAPQGFLAENYQKIVFSAFTVSDNEEERTFCAPGSTEENPECYLLYSDNNQASFAYGNEKKGEEGKNVARGCEVLPIKIYNLSKCFLCPLTAAVFSAANEVTIMSFKSFKDAFCRVLIVAFAVWLAFASLQIVFTYTKQDGNKYLSSLILQGGKILIAYFLLNNAGDLFIYFILPVLKAGMVMAKNIAAVEVTPINYIPSTLENAVLFNAGNFYEEVEKFVAGVQSQLAVMQAIGASLFCAGIHQMSIWSVKDVFTLISNLGIGIRIVALGGVLFIFALLLIVSFGFYFLDAIIQLAIMGAMLPLMIAGWPFKLTSNYAKTGYKMLLNVFFSIFFIGFVISVELNLVNKALEEINRKPIYEYSLDGFRVNSTYVGEDRSGGLGGLFKAINTQNGNDIRELTDIGFGGFLLLIFACFFGFKFVSNVPKLAEKLSDAPSLDVAVKAGTVGASAAKGVAKVAISPFTNLAKEKWRAGGGFIGATGRLIQAPGKFMSKLGNTKLGQKMGVNASSWGNGTVSRLGQSIEGWGKNVTARRADAESLAGIKNKIDSSYMLKHGKSMSKAQLEASARAELNRRKNKIWR